MNPDIHYQVDDLKQNLLLINHSTYPNPIIPLAESVKFEDSFTFCTRDVQFAVLMLLSSKALILRELARANYLICCGWLICQA